ncbi:hypothetical protein M2352_000052 [Azospirillum fermentarium]|uniref:hypothetical protein n=1 Tax=Azospirillum fermentarium TaxID=1233114 RepID=UPI002226E729|nr:hypothetical protein [Azospirillum fermentarium]MCW2244461.1 hypothetical protein [Azospirillum fermentarium]
MSWLAKLSGGKKGDSPSGSTRRRAQSVPPVRIIIDRNEYQAEEFALGSFRIRPYDGDLIAKQQFDFRLAFALGEEAFDIACRGQVVKLDEKSGLVARYQKPQPFYERKLVEYICLLKGV